jgi:flavin-dependent dehydrogenase
VRRTVLQQALEQRARAVGVRIVEGRVDAIEQDDRGIRAAGVDARYLVGADGLHSTVRRLTGLAAPSDGPQRFGVRQHFARAPWTALVEVHWLPDCEVYVTPVADEVVGVAVLGEAPISLEAAVRRLPALADRLGDADAASRQRGAGPLRQSTVRRTAGRALLAGDAAGYVDALTGEGLRVGFAEAEAVVRAVLADDVPGYEAEWWRITRSYRWLTRGLLVAASSPRLRPMIVPAAQVLPGVFRRVVDTLAS